MYKKKRAAQALRFLRWTKKYNGWWQLICEPKNEHMNIKMMQMLIKRLAEKEFYEIIFVLLEVHKNKEFMKNTRDGLLNELLISERKDGNKDAVIQKFVEYLE